MNKYEYIKLDCGDDPSEEGVLDAIKNEDWVEFKSQTTVLDFVAEEILTEKCSDWEVFDEDDGVCLVVRKAESNDFEVFWVSVCYRFYTQSVTIFDSDDFKDKEDTM